MAICLITPPQSVPHEAATLNALFQHGLTAAHVRKPDWPAARVRELLSQVDAQHHPHIRLHQHHELVHEFSVGGVHYPERALPPLPLQPLVVDALQGDGCDPTAAGPRHQPSRRTLLQSTSLHSLEQLEQLGSYGALDYAFLSPIFDSISKQGYTSAQFDPARLRSLLQQQQLPVIALGGISAATCAQAMEMGFQAMEMGFQGVAVLGAIWEAEDPVHSLKQLQLAAAGAKSCPGA